MNKYFVIIRSIACFICLFSLFLGCDNQAESPQKPKVIKKRIVVQKDMALKAEKPEKIDASSSESKIDALKAKSDLPDLPDLAAPTDTPGFYDSEGKIDPFARFYRDKFVDMADRDEKGKRRIPLTPLEKVDLSQLKLTGIIRSPGGNRAMVEEASGKGYIIKRGAYIGIHSGRVIKILKDRIIVEEEVEDILGNVTIDKTELKLQKPPGEE